MYCPRKVRVVTPDARENSVPLIDLVDDPTFRSSVQGSDDMSTYFLTSMDYDSFMASPTARVLSYWWQEKLTVDCKIIDPAGIVQHIKGEINTSFLRTPQTGWTELWVDFLNHLNDWGAFYEFCMPSMGALYLGGIVLPQYFYLDWLTCDTAMARGWMHQEISYGKLDRAATESFLKKCAELYFAQSGTNVFMGNNPHKCEAIRFLTSFAMKRVTAATSKAGGKLWGKAKFLGGCVLVYGMGTEEYDVGLQLNIAKNYQIPAIEQCKKDIDSFLDIMCAAQLSEDTAVNLKALEDPTIAWTIIVGASNTNFTEKTDMYYASLQVIGAACGFAIRSPLVEFFKKHGGDLPRNPDGSVRFGATDLDLQALNTNYEVLRRCWRTMSSGDSMKQIPMEFMLIDEAARPRMKPGTVPMGAATLGLGPMPKSKFVGVGNISTLHVKNGPSLQRHYLDSEKSFSSLTWTYADDKVEAMMKHVPLRPPTAEMVLFPKGTLTLCYTTQPDMSDDVDAFDGDIAERAFEVALIYDPEYPRRELDSSMFFDTCNINQFELHHFQSSDYIVDAVPPDQNEVHAREKAVAVTNDGRSRKCCKRRQVATE